MDNAPYHSIVKNKAPTSASRVDEIKLWLLENDAAYDDSSRKPDGSIGTGKKTSLTMFMLLMIS